LARLAAAAASLAALAASQTDGRASCESQSGAGGPADDDSEGGDGANVSVRDGMDAGSESGSESAPAVIIVDEGGGSGGPADEEEDTSAEGGNDNIDAGGEEEDDDDDDPSKDEDTSCSICLINRQGPCRKYWLKFERCMKEHGGSAEKNKEDEADVNDDDEESSSTENEGDKKVSEEGERGGRDGNSTMEEEWDAFMEKSIRPGEDDDDDDEDDDGDDDEDEDEDDDEDEDEIDSTSSDDDNANKSEESASEGPRQQQEEKSTLAQRCDRFMMPWISCIQEHRNVYSLISNAFYQKDYVDPLEDAVDDDRRMCYRKIDDAESGGDGEGYIVRFYGVELDLGSWREHVEADADDANGDDGFEDETPVASASSNTDEPHLINAYAKFQLTDPSGSGRPIEVAYVKDQRGRLLGFDSFTKRDEAATGTGEGDDNANDKDAEGTATESTSLDGECTFHIVPGETTSIAAYAIYRGVKRNKEDEGSDEGGSGTSLIAREDFLYHTRDVSLPGARSGQK